MLDSSAIDADVTSINAVIKISFAASEPFLFNWCKGLFIFILNFFKHLKILITAKYLA